MGGERLLLFLLALGSALGPAAALDASNLTPRVGETTREYESRIGGLAPEAPAGDLVSVAADQNGQFVVKAQVNGRPLEALIDTGASVVTLTYEDAERLGAPLSEQNFTVTLNTANGALDAAPVRVGEIKVGGIVARDVDALVLPKGRLETNLLGMSFLARIGGLAMSEGRLTLRN